MLETAVSRVLFPPGSSPACPKVTTICLCLLPDIHRTTPLGCLLAVAALPALLLRLCFLVRTIRRSPRGIGGAARTFLDPPKRYRSSPPFPVERTVSRDPEIRNSSRWRRDLNPHGGCPHWRLCRPLPSHSVTPPCSNHRPEAIAAVLSADYATPV